MKSNNTFNAKVDLTTTAHTGESILSRDQKWIDESLASGPETPLNKKEMNAIRDRVLKNKT